MAVSAPRALRAPFVAGARRIVRWEIRHVFAVGVNEAHPANKKVKAWVYLRDLQREHGLTGARAAVAARNC